MKKYFFLIALPLLFAALFTSKSADAQVVRRHRARVEAGKPAYNPQRARTRRRVRRRTFRRINRRAYSSIPVGTATLNYNSVNYYPINGFYYVKQNSEFVSVLPPVGFRVATIPFAYTSIVVKGSTYYYSNGLYYIQNKSEYEITEPPVGAKISELPEGYEQININDEMFYSFDDMLYKKAGEGYELVGFLDDKP